MGFVRNVFACGAASAIGACVWKYARSDLQKSGNAFLNPRLEFPGKEEEITEIFKKYVVQELKDLGHDPTRSHPLFREGDMSRSQRLYVIEQFSNLKDFYGAQGNAPATIARDLAESFHGASLEEARVVVDASLKSPCDYLYYRRGEIRFRNPEAESYAKSQDAQAFVKCAKESPVTAMDYEYMIGGVSQVKKLLTQEQREALYQRTMEFYTQWKEKNNVPDNELSWGAKSYKEKMEKAHLFWGVQPIRV